MNFGTILGIFVAGVSGIALGIIIGQGMATCF